MPDGARQRRGVSRIGLERLVGSAAGGLLLRPWFDDAALRLLTQWYFPLSRGWAAALAAEGSVERFLRELPCGRFSRRLLPSILSRVETRRAVLAAVDSKWEEAFFGSGPARAEIEALQRHAASALTNVRAAGAAAYGDAVADRLAGGGAGVGSGPAWPPPRLFAAGIFGFIRCFDRRAVARLSLASRHGRLGALSRSDGGDPGSGVGARLHTRRHSARRLPDHAVADFRTRDRYGNGVCRRPPESAGALVTAGIRVIRPEGPWHGRRRLPGTYGGEPVLARGPGGLLDYFHTRVVELGRLTAWARATRGGRPARAGG